MTTGDAPRCRYTFSPDAESTASTADDPVDDAASTTDEHCFPVSDGGTWRCHRPVDGESDYCLFHRPPEETDDERVVEAFVDALESAGESRRDRQFVGARFGDVSLPYEVLDGPDNYPIDLRHAQFEGTVRFEYATFRQPLYLSGAAFEAPVVLRDATFEDDVFLDDATFVDALDASETRFGDDATFAAATLRDADFSEASFDGDADFSAVTFAGRAAFADATFREDAAFDGAAFATADFSAAAFEEWVTFSELRVPDATEATRCRIDLYASAVAGGRLAHASDAVYDLTDATLGDVSLSWGDDAGLSRAFRFWNTDFDGFSFERYRDHLYANDWRIHGDVDPFDRETSDGARRVAELEDTYRKARNGANRAGDTKAEAEFYRKEMGYRRRHHAREARDATNSLRTRAKAGADWVGNALLSATTGYGERPSRVVVASVGTIALFTATFAVLLQDPSFGTPLGYVLLGMESFVTLVLGGSPPVENTLVQVLAQVEAFFGAYLIALFVFTLTRSLHR